MKLMKVVIVGGGISGLSCAFRLQDLKKEHNLPLAITLLEKRDRLGGVIQTHHPDGFCQFSGHGVLSGKDDHGNPKGIGVFAAPLADVGSGPAFCVALNGLDRFETIADARAGDLVIDTGNIFGPLGDDDFVIEGHYFQPELRRFIFLDESGQHRIEIPHPCGTILRLRVTLAPDDVEYPGFVGLDCFRTKVSLPGSGFTLSGPAENDRQNERGQRLIVMKANARLQQSSDSASVCTLQGEARRSPSEPPTIATIRQAVEAMFDPGQPVELRALGVTLDKYTQNKIFGGYFDDFDMLAECAAKLAPYARGVYVTLNPPHRRLRVAAGR